MQLVDTNVVSELMRTRPNPGVLEWKVRAARFALSAITVEELLFGLSLKRMGRLEMWLEELVRDHCEVLPVSDGVARESGRLRASLQLSGKIRHLPDMLIAATARVHNLVLVSRNVRDFSESGIRLFNPFSS